MSRDARLRVYDRVEACQRIERYVAGVDEVQLRQNDQLLDAILRNIEVLGEAARHVTDEVRAAAPGIPWREISGIRDILIHGYFRVDFEIVCDVAFQRVPLLKPQLEELLETMGRG